MSSSESDGDVASMTETFCLKQDLLEKLDDIQARGSFAYFQGDPDIPSRGVSVEGVGDIPMPLNEAYATKLINKASQAPFGKGADTLVDTSVRKTWEFDANQFTFQEPAEWDNFLQRTCATVAKELGIDGLVKAEIYKMLLYNKGAMFKPHTDTEKIPGMFGTLVVSLPSRHEGGDLLLKHGGEACVFRTSKVASAIACWYADVSHEILPITSGCRWVLTYNLTKDTSYNPTSPPGDSFCARKQNSLREIFQTWASDEPNEYTKQELIYHVLDHSYSEKNLSFMALKGRDLAQVEALERACEGLPFEIFLVILEKQREYTDDEEPIYDDEVERDWDSEEENSDTKSCQYEKVEYYINTLRPLLGGCIPGTFTLRKRNLLQPHCFEGRDPDEQDAQVVTGNSGASSTSWYKQAAIMIAPHRKLSAALQSWSDQDRESLNSRVEYLTKLCLRPAAGKVLIDALLNACRESLLHPKDRNSYYGYNLPRPAVLNPGNMASALRIAIEQGEYEFFDQMSDSPASTIPYDFFAWTGKWLTAEPTNVAERLAMVKSGLTKAIGRKTQSLSDLYIAVTHLVPSVDDNKIAATNHIDSLIAFARELIISGLQGAPKYDSLAAEHAVALANVFQCFDEPGTLLSETIMPRVEPRNHQTPFFVTFLTMLPLKVKKGVLPKQECARLCDIGANALASTIDFSKLYGPEAAPDVEGPNKQPRCASYDGCRPEKPRLATQPEQLADFIALLLDVDKDAIDEAEVKEDGASTFITKITDQADTLPSEELPNLWLEFASHLATRLQDRGLALDAPPYKDMFSALIQNFIGRWMGPEPRNKRGLAQPEETFDNRALNKEHDDWLARAKKAQVLTWDLFNELQLRKILGSLEYDRISVRLRAAAAYRSNPIL